MSVLDRINQMVEEENKQEKEMVQEYVAKLRAERKGVVA
jgi:hypothetical protein